MTNAELMASGQIYLPGDTEILIRQRECLELLYDFNATRPGEMERRNELLSRMLASCGKDCYIEPPFHANWGGRNLHLGDSVYANFNLTCVDDTDIYIGSYTMIGPNVTIATACHPFSPELRKKGAQYNKKVMIGENVWLGAGVIVLPGVTIGDNSIIGAGSIVTSNIPANVLAFGTPCRVAKTVLDRARGEPPSETGL